MGLPEGAIGLAKSTPVEEAISVGASRLPFNPIDRSLGLWQHPIVSKVPGFEEATLYGSRRAR